MRDIKDIKNWNKDDFVQAHRELWWKIAEMEIRGHQIVDTPKLDAIVEIFGRDSDNYYGFLGLLYYGHNSCFACFYATLQNRLYSDMSIYGCENCLLSWPDGKYCRYVDGLYGQWAREENYNRKAELAAQIANLPVRG